ncbi:MAG TPA: patatin family protein, partial [Methanocorpusculum sp.]|nr:patatin family protein [Methanocorpusculum sp.]
FVRSPQRMRQAYCAMLRKYPKIVEMIDERHLRYRETLKWVYEMEKEGRIFIFAPPENTGVSTSTKDFDLLQKLYDKGIEDYNLKREELISYLED